MSPSVKLYIYKFMKKLRLENKIKQGIDTFKNNGIKIHYVPNFQEIGMQSFLRHFKSTIPDHG